MSFRCNLMFSLVGVGNIIRIEQLIKQGAGHNDGDF